MTNENRKTAELLVALGRHRLMAILRAANATHFGAVADCLVECGVKVAEFALTGDGVLEALAAYARHKPAELLLGAGTVMNRELAKAAIDAGATFLVTPACIPAVIDEGVRQGVPVLSGSLTPTEVNESWSRGAAAVKVFPASLGGPAYLRALRDPLPDIPLVPTGGVPLGAIREFLAAGAVGVGLGGALLGDALASGDLTGLRRRAVTALAECGEPG